MTPCAILVSRMEWDQVGVDQVWLSEPKYALLYLGYANIR